MFVIFGTLFPCLSHGATSTSVTSPVSRQVIQRDAANTADIPISGTVTGSADSIEARAVVMADGSNNGTTTPWTTIDTTIVSNSFSGTLPDVSAGGWYQIETRCVVGGVPDQSSTVTRIGVGDIYLTCGQSNAANRGTPAYSPNEDRFSALLYSTGAWSLAADPMPGAPVTNPSYTGSPWSRFGEMLVDRDNVPVALVCFAESGSDVTQWLPGNPLYSRIKTAVKRFPINGFKGILWHQGETNAGNGNTAAQYQSWLSTVIAQSRMDAGWAVPWYVAEASRINAGLAKEEPIVAGQRATIYADPHTFAGPVTDNFHQEGKISDDTVHFNAAGLYDHAAQWAEILGGNPALTPKNANFESNPVLTDGTRAVINNANTGSPSVIAWRGLNAANDGAATTNTYGYYNPNSSYYLNTDDAGPNGGVLPNMSGPHVAFLEDSASNASFLQTRRALLVANTTYTLTVAVGVRTIETTTTFGGATIELLADGNVISSRTIDRAELNTLNGGSASGTFTDVSMTATTGQNVTSGQSLAIRIRKPGGTNTYLDFDNVRLTSAAATSPSISWSGVIDAGWANGGNWTDGSAPVNDLTTDIAVFNLSSYPHQPDAATRSVAGIRIGDGATTTAALNLTGTQLSLGLGGIDMQVNAGAATLDAPVTLGAYQTWRNASANPLSVTSTLGAAGPVNNGGFVLTCDAIGPINFSRSVNGTGGLIKEGTGTLTLTGTNTFTGATSIHAGTLEIGDAGTLNGGNYAGAITTAYGATLSYKSSAAQTLSGTISGAGDLVKSGAGMLTLSGTKSYTGNTVINGGKLRLDNSVIGTAGTQSVSGAGTLEIGSISSGLLAWGSTNATVGADFTGLINVTTVAPASGFFISANSNFASNMGDMNIASGVTMFINASSVQSDALTGSGTINNNSTNTANAATLRIGANDGDGNFSGTITNNTATISLTKLGSGTQILSGTNSYTGTTTVSGGTLKINGAKNGAGTVTVSNAATLGGSGSIAGATTVQFGGTLAPGNSVGNLTFTSTVDLQSGSIYAAEISGAATNDKITASGTLTVNGTVKVTLLGGYSPASGAVFDLADATIAGTPAFDFTAAPLGDGLAWNTASFATKGTISVVTSDPFATWASTNNVTGGKFDDDDHDGVSNLLEFATAANPQSGFSGARACPLIHVIGGQPVLTYTVAVRAGAIFAASGPKQQADKDLVRYTVEASADLASWNTVAVTELAPADAAPVQSALGAQLEGLDSAWQWHSFRAAGDTASAPKDFIRLNVGVAP